MHPVLAFVDYQKKAFNSKSYIWLQNDSEPFRL